VPPVYVLRPFDDALGGEPAEPQAQDFAVAGWIPDHDSVMSGMTKGLNGYSDRLKGLMTNFRGIQRFYDTLPASPDEKD
jgi:hypothetical protein